MIIRGFGEVTKGFSFRGDLGRELRFYGLGARPRTCGFRAGLNRREGGREGGMEEGRTCSKLGSISVQGFPGGTSGKQPTCQCRRLKKCQFDPWVKKIPWRRKWQPTPVFLPGNFLGQRSLVGLQRVGELK